MNRKEKKITKGKERMGGELTSEKRVKKTKEKKEESNK